MRAASIVVLIAIALTLSACSPQYDWREIRSEAAPYVVLLPTRPTTFSRKINLNGIPVSMTMTASEVDGVTFAVGTAELPDATQAQVSLGAMKIALVNNIGGTVRQEKTLTMAQTRNATSGTVAVLEIEASGPASAATKGQARVLFARFVAQEKRVYQLVVTGSEKAVSRDIVDTFFSSFQLH